MTKERLGCVFTMLTSWPGVYVPQERPLPDNFGGIGKNLAINRPNLHNPLSRPFCGVSVNLNLILPDIFGGIKGKHQSSTAPIAVISPTSMVNPHPILCGFTKVPKIHSDGCLQSAMFNNFIWKSMIIYANIYAHLWV